MQFVYLQDGFPEHGQPSTGRKKKKQHAARSTNANAYELSLVFIYFAPQSEIKEFRSYCSSKTSFIAHKPHS